MVLNVHPIEWWSTYDDKHYGSQLPGPGPTLVCGAFGSGTEFTAVKTVKTLQQ